MYNRLRLFLMPYRRTTFIMASLWDDLQSLVDSPSSAAAEGGQRGTIKPKANFDAEKDAAALKDAIKGLGTNEKVLIEILTQRSNDQRQLICKAYEGATGRTLEKDLKGDTGGNFEELLLALITPPAAYDCHEVTRAMKGAGTKDSVLIEIFASRSKQQIKALKDVYRKETEKDLIEKLQSEASGDFSTALILLAKGERDGSNSVDVGKAKEDAEVKKLNPKSTIDMFLFCFKLQYFFSLRRFTKPGRRSGAQTSPSLSRSSAKEAYLSSGRF
uniref:Annexin n=1 Tax=Poecilia reticulata TaxID=8081 RepID=A0A3P9N5U1_POERE